MHETRKLLFRGEKESRTSKRPRRHLNHNIHRQIHRIHRIHNHSHHQRMMIHYQDGIRKTGGNGMSDWMDLRLHPDVLRARGRPRSHVETLQWHSGFLDFCPGGYEEQPIYINCVHNTFTRDFFYLLVSGLDKVNGGSLFLRVRCLKRNKIQDLTSSRPRTANASETFAEARILVASAK